MIELAPDHAGRARVARKLGEVAGEHCRNKADVHCPGFSDRAFDFITRHARSMSADETFAGEDLTNLMKGAGIVPHDDRAFGGIYAKAIRQGYIRIVGERARVKGHGAPGGRVYAAGLP